MPTGISYLDEVWQPVTGCSPCSPGCENCYAAGTISRFLQDHRRYKGLAVNGKWTGEVRCNEEDLTQPLRWKKPRTIGTVFMGDLFHPDVLEKFLQEVFAVMHLAKQHTFVLCTKRAERMRDFLTGPMRPEVWPLPNCHLGVTVESSGQIHRIEQLQYTPASHRWISYEPAIGALIADLGPAGAETCSRGVVHRNRQCECLPGIDGLTIGCESGPNRRPFDLDWARRVRDDCEAAGVKLYVKQLSIDGKVVTDSALFPEDLRQRELAWPVGKRGE